MIATTVLVVDASAIAEMLIGTAKGRQVAMVIGSDHSLHAPDLLSLEIASVARGLIRSGEITVAEADQVVIELGALGIEFYEHLPFLPRVLQLRDNFTAYDAIYVALAETLAATLLTCDVKFGRSPAHRAAVQLVDE